MHPVLSAERFQEARSYLRLAKWTPAQSVRRTIYQKVSAGVRQNLELDHAKWHTRYFIKPYWYAMNPDSQLYRDLREEVDACLNFDIETQEADGSAHLTFNVSGHNEMQKWKSIWTLESLVVLKNYDRIAVKDTRLWH